MRNMLYSFLLLSVLTFTACGTKTIKKQEYINFRHEISTSLVSMIYVENEDTDNDDDVALCDGSGYIVQGDGHRTACPGCIACNGNGDKKVEEKKVEEKASEEKPPLPEPEPEPKKKVTVITPKVKVEVDNYTPRWNVNGDMRKALNRADLMFHLRRDHNVDADWMKTKSTDDLQRLHDTMHEQSRTKKFSTPQNIGGT